ncbi:Allergen Asp f 7 [Penicillium cataractarum]|uniref:Allergen Asp f 7 n=1 Tax=Penicillium cataractarum TaxID=2100454 RepID=A0A9W9USZ9_9EURO|nr:Allergen Asp f 7 [Penicillium cataractarum]KAJ5355464.1 Allergen Asp f 7 [Penicillium cataractarum]
MAPITKTLALAGALFAVSGFAAPVNKRAVVWETVTDVVWETVDVTTTIYPGGHATATVIPVVTTSAVETTSTGQAAAAAQTLQEEEATTTSTSVAVPTTTAQATTTAAPVVQAAAESSSTSSAASTTSSASSSSSSTTSSGYSGSCDEGSPCSGDITYYDTATTSSNPSSCGTTNDGTTERVLALPHGIMTDSDCGKTVTVSYNGETVTGTVVDKCMGCDDTSIDLSRAFFEAVAGSLDAGRISGVEWYIN